MCLEPPFVGTISISDVLGWEESSQYWWSSGWGGSILDFKQTTRWRSYHNGWGNSQSTQVLLCLFEDKSQAKRSQHCNLDFKKTYFMWRVCCLNFKMCSRMFLHNTLHGLFLQCWKAHIGPMFGKHIYSKWFQVSVQSCPTDTLDCHLVMFIQWIILRRPTFKTFAWCLTQCFRLIPGLSVWFQIVCNG